MSDLPLNEDDRRRAETRLHLEMLKRALHDDPLSLDARLALAAAYRELGLPDQAGRWGALTDGWATEIERDRFARLLGASGVGKSEIRSFLLLPSGAPVPSSVTDLIAGPAADYQVEFGIRGRTFSQPPTVAAGLAASWLASGAGAVSLITVLAVYFVALTGNPLAPFIARLGGAGVVAFALAAVAAWAISRALDRRRRQRDGVPYVRAAMPRSGAGSR
jgi:hypothetical protein